MYGKIGQLANSGNYIRSLFKAKGCVYRDVVVMTMGENVKDRSLNILTLIYLFVFRYLLE